MRNSSIRHGWILFVAGAIALAGVAAEARTLTLTAAQLRDPHASAAKQWIERAHAGWYYQDASGAWKKK